MNPAIEYRLNLQKQEYCNSSSEPASSATMSTEPNILHSAGSISQQGLNTQRPTQHSVLEPFSLPQDSATLLPDKIARAVSAITNGSTISLRLGTYVASTVLDSARFGMITTLGFARRALEGLLHRTEVDTTGKTAHAWTTSSIEAVNKMATFSQLFTAVAFHFASTSLDTASGFAQDSVHLIDAVFGSTESSRAIAAIIALVRRELGEGVGVYSLLTGLTCFSILQSTGWRRTIQEIETHRIWDVVVLDTGETLSQQFPKPPGKTKSEIDEDTIIEAMPYNSRYRISVTEVTIRTLSVEVSGPMMQIPKFDIPNGASIVHEEARELDQDNIEYSLTLQTSSREFFERNGVTPSEQGRAANELTDSQYKQPFHDYPHQSSITGFHPTLDTILSDADDDDILRVRSPVTYLSRSFSDTSLSSKMENAFKHSESLLDTESPANRSLGFSMVPGNHQTSQAYAPTTFPRSKSVSALASETGKAVEEYHPTFHVHPKIKRKSHEHHKRTSSVFTLQSDSTDSAFRNDEACEFNGLDQQQKFPPGHITQNMAKYMRFATASYGLSFMYALGIGKIAYHHFPTSNSDHHYEHHAFAHHTKLALHDILLSSYSDRTLDDSSGISLVHFVSVDHDAKAVVLTIRGTLGLEDILTDLTCDYEIMEWQNHSWKAHGGMLKCAQILKRSSSRVLKTICTALENWGPEYGLVICGHSLGGGVSALFGILLSEISPEGIFVTSESSLLPAGRRIHCFAYGPPAAMSVPLRKATRGLITTVVYGLDLVPCLSLGLLRDFQSVAIAFSNDQQGVVNEIKRRFLSQLTSRHNPLDGDDDFLWSILKTLRAVMQSEKLVPPGEVYSISTNTFFETYDGKPKRATRIVGNLIVDVEKRFREPVFGVGIFHHSPVHYEQALSTLEMGVCNAPIH